MQSISIIIVNWNTCDYLDRCLESLQQYSRSSDFEIIVVDNASQDGSIAMLQERYPNVRIVESTKNLGFAAGNNLAIRESHAEWIFLLNPDTVLNQDVLNKLTSFFVSNPDAGAVSPKLINPDGTLQVSSWPFPTLFREFWRLFHLDLLYPISQYPRKIWEQQTPQAVGYVQGTAILLRREVFDQVGLFDEDYFMYTEEVDLCRRIKQAGWEIFWYPRAEVIHFGGTSTRQAAPQMFLELYRSKILYFRKHHGNFQALLYKGILFLAAIPRLVAGLFNRDSSLRKNYLSLIRNLQDY